MEIHSIPSHTISLLKSVQGFKAPDTIYLQSDSDPHEILKLLPEYGFAIVGTRYPQRRSFELLEKTIRDLQGSGLVIVSGFARGIDSRAHELAIEYGLKTIAILGAGIDFDYPQENRALRKKIVASGGFLLSQFPLGTQAYPSNFLERNQLIAGFGCATWVVEAAEVSGTLNTATWAMSMNRNLYATSCFPGDPFFKGNEKLLSQKQTGRFPIAEAFFGTHSLSTTWSFLDEAPELDFGEGRRRALTKIQQWVLELQGEFGSCQIQTLMNYASSKGMTLGSFYLEFEKEIENGNLIQDPSGRIEASKCRK